MRKKLLFGLACLSMFACQSEKKSKDGTDSTQISSSMADADTLTYSYDSVKVYSKNPVSTDKQVTDTAKAVIVFPKFNDNTLNRFIEDRVCLNAAVPDKSYKSYKEVANSFMHAFDENQTYNEDRVQTWFFEAKVVVLRQATNFVALKFSQIEYMGGAHPNSASSYVNYDHSSHQVLTLDSILKPNTFSKLQNIAEQIFRKNEELTPTQSLADAYFFDKDKFHLNANFSITKQGLEFLYNPYEIKPYAAGTTTLIIPYTAIKDLIKPNSVIYQVNKDAGM